ncbi:MAG: ATP-grasp domain-containing protein [Anaerolineae bacterium]
MKVLVVYNIVDLLDKGHPDDILAERETQLVEQAVEQSLRSFGHEVVAVPIRDQLWEPLRRFDPNEWLIFNLCESIRDKTYLEPYVISVYEYLHFRYTGSSRLTLGTCLNKARTKEILQAHGIPTASFQVMGPPTVRRQLDFPLFVKPIAEDASLGITMDSVVENERELRQQVKFIWDTYRQPALVESFISGREFNVTLLGNENPRVMPISEINFRHIRDPKQRIVTFKGKWVEDSSDYKLTQVISPARINESLREKISEVAVHAYQTMGLRDYGRVDIRVQNGVPYVLEVNPNADLSPDAGIARSARVAGMAYAELADEIIRLAAHRYRLKFARPRIISLRLKARSAGADGIREIPVSAFAKDKKRELPAPKLAPAVA